MIDFERRKNSSLRYYLWFEKGMTQSFEVFYIFFLPNLNFLFLFSACIENLVMLQFEEDRHESI